MKRDYYEILGIDRDATDEEIKRSFRRLAFRYHPDYNGHDEAAEKFKEVNEAYEVLSDPEKRTAYDRYGHSNGEALLRRSFEGGDFGGFGGIFDTFFGGAAPARPAPQRGSSLHCRLNITFEEAAFGVEKKVMITRTEYCSLCQGSGSRPESHPIQCPNCAGSGEVRRIQPSIFGRFVTRGACSQCGGEGRIITEPCGQCSGTGREKRRRSLTVRVPPGIDAGNQIRLSGEGNAGTKGGPPGNLYVSMSISPHKLFRRSGDDIVHELPINFAQAALGGEVEVPTLEGKTMLKVPAGTQTGKVFRLRSKGFPHMDRGGRGDQVVTLRVITPGGLTDKQLHLFEELAKTLE